ncbi:MAG: hypothetical protein LBD73_02980 [Deferribacteraceae bacterium]|nr:hypothetical protein [Deferribacteraceae bacterium]
MPSLFLFKLALGAVFYEIVAKKRFYWAFTVFLFAINFMLLPKFHTELNNKSYAEIIAFLKDENLKDGYGSYWNAQIISAATGFENEVYQVTSFTYPDKPGIYRFIFTSDRSWYVKPVNYLIVSENSALEPNVNDQEILAFAYAQFGTPQKEVSIQRRKILIWDYDISTKLEHVYLRFRHMKRRWKDGVWEADGRNGSLIGFMNNYDKPLKVAFEMNIEGDFDTELYFSGAVNGSVNLKKGGRSYYANSFILKPGRTNLVFSTPSKFRITDLKYGTEKIE